MMPGIPSWRRLGAAVVGAACFLMLAAGIALAEESGGGWRATYDLAMRWVNFVILAAVIVKFMGRPLKDFLKGKQDEIAIEINRLEKEKQRLQDRVEETRKELLETSMRFEELKARVIRQGEKTKQQIIDDAQLETRLLMESARRMIDNRLNQARLDLRGEIIDLAFSRALKHLPAEMTDEDNHQLVQQFIAGAFPD